MPLWGQLVSVIISKSYCIMLAIRRELPKFGGMLRWVGFNRAAAVLDGGLKARKEEDRPLSTEIITRPAKHLTSAPQPELIADRDEVLASIDGDAVCLIDAIA